MIVPSLHLNGTPKRHLTDAIIEADTAIMAALGALAETSPNARDYYPQGPEAYAQAVREHEDRCKRLLSVRAELVKLYEAIEEARS